MQCNGRRTSTSSTQSPSKTATPSSTVQMEYQQLLHQCQNHAEFFKNDHSGKSQRLYAAFVAWQDFIRLADKLVQQIDEFSYKYDFDAETPGNGYRSFSNITKSCILYGLNICKNIAATRGTIFFRKKFYVKEVEACSQLLSSLCTCLQYLLILHEWSCDSGDLFANGDHTVEELLAKGDTINQYSFYGRCLGFQYSDTVRSILTFICTGMAGFSESFYAGEADSSLLKTTRTVWASGKCLLNPELRARRIVNISQNSKIDFCKSFWFLAESEMMQLLPTLVGSTIKKHSVLEIPAEPLQIPRAQKKTQQSEKNAQNNANDELIDIPVPSSHLGPGLPITARLLSATRRSGMIGIGGGTSSSGSHKLHPASSCILFHCHGGGFVAQSSKSHELYLRDWAVALDVPIFSIDYSLAPEAPFPRALEEIFYAYCWMLKNADLLGTTAERIVLAGDSAGANLCTSLTLKCIEAGIRIPDGLFLAYCPTLISFVPSPARLLCLMDPLLPFGFMMRCLRAYAAPDIAVLQKNAKHVAHKADIRNAGANDERHALHLDNGHQSEMSSRRTSAAKSPNSSLAENSKWEQIKLKNNGEFTVINSGHDRSGSDEEDSSYTFASASYHSQTIERTELPSVEDDNSSCVSFEDDSQPIEHYPIELSAERKLTNAESVEYIDRFLDQYLIDTNTMEVKEEEDDNGSQKMAKPNRINGIRPTVAKTVSEENLFYETGKDILAIETLHGRISSAVSSISSTFKPHYAQSDDNQPIQNLRNLDALIARSPSLEFVFTVPRDPFLSPYWASDEWLSKMPNTKILSLETDPCLDDCVMFAKKLKHLGRPVSLDILKGLPHGFLNFTMVSKEAMEGSKHCIKAIQELFSLTPKEENVTTTTSTSSTTTSTTTTTTNTTTTSQTAFTANDRNP